MAEQGGSVRWIIEADDSQFQKALDSANQSVQNFSKNINKNGDTSSLAKNAENTAKRTSKSFMDMATNVASAWSKSLSSVSSGLDKITQAASKIEGTFSGITNKLSLATTAFATMGTKSGLGLAQQMEDASTGLKFILGSEEQAAHAISRIREEAERTPFDVGNLTQFTQQLSTFTKNSDSAIDALMAMGSATVASGYGVENLGNAVLNLGQAFNNAWTYMDYRQMLNAVPMFKTIADEAGLTWEKMQKIQDLSKKTGSESLGQVLTQVFSEWGAVNDVFAETQNNLSQLKARFEETFAGAFYDAMKASGAIEIIKNAIKTASDALDKNKGVITAAFKQIAEFLGQIDISTLIQSALSLVKSFIGALQVVLKVIKDVATVIGFGDMSRGISIIANFIIYTTLASKAVKLLSGSFSILTKGAGLLMEAFSVNPFLTLAAGAIILVNVLVDLGEKFGWFAKIGEFFANVWTNVVNWFKNLPQTLVTIGHNIVTGLANGIINGARTVYQAAKTVATNTLGVFKSILRIASPSKVMTQYGEFVGLGLARGITDSDDVVQDAMENLANDILKIAEKVVQNKVDFNIINVAGQYKEWKKVSEMFVVGSAQYQTAIERMEEARKSANLQIVKLQETYNEKLDDTISKISSMYGLFDEVDMSGGKNANQIINNLDQQVAKMQEWATDQEIIAGLNLDPKFIEELQQMGVDATYELSAIAGMTTDQIAQMNTLWLKKQEIATKSATQQLSGFKNETLNKISEIKNGIDAETVDVKEVGGKLVSNISEGIYGAIPTLEQAFSQLGEYVKNSSKNIGESAGGANSADIASALANPFEEGGEDAIEKIGISVEDIGKKIFKILSVGLLGGIAVKLGKEVLKHRKSISSAVSQVGNIDTSGIANATTNITNSINQTGAAFAKTEAFLDVIKKGAQDIIWIAGAIAAMAVAIRIAYEALKEVDFVGFAVVMGELVIAISSIGALALAIGEIQKHTEALKSGLVFMTAIAGDIALLGVAIAFTSSIMPDFGNFAEKMGALAIAIAGMGGLALALGEIEKHTEVLVTGLLLMVGIAADIALVGLALGVADLAIQSDFGTLVEKLGAMGIAITEIGVLAGIIGAIVATGVGAVILGAGLVAMVGIAGAMVTIGLAIAEINLLVPDDLDKVKSKVDLICNTVNYMTSQSVGNIFSNAIKMVELLTVTGIATAYAAIGADLFIIQSIPLDADAIIEKIELIKWVTEKIGVGDDKSLGSVIKGLVSGFAEVMKTVNIALIVSVYAGMARDLEKIQSVDLHPDQIVAKVAVIKDIVDLIGNTGEGSITNQIRSVVATFLDYIKTVSVSAIVDTYAGMADNLMKIQDLELDKGAVISKINLLGQIVDIVAAPAESNGFFTALFNAAKVALDVSVVENATKILNIYSTIGDTLSRIQNIDADLQGVKTKVEELQQIVQLIIDMKGDGGIFGAIGNFFTGNPINEEQVSKVVSILNKMSEISASINGMQGVYVEGAKIKINEVGSVIYEIANIKDPGNLSNREWVVGMATSISYKIREFIDAFGGIGAIKEELKTYANNAIDAVWNVCSVNTGVGDLSAKEWIIGMATSMAYKLAEFNSALSAVGDNGDKTEVVEQLLTTMERLISGVETKLSDRLAEMEQAGTDMALKFRDGMLAQETEVYNAGQKLQSFMWNGIQAKMNDEFEQGKWMAKKFAEGLANVNNDIYNAGANAQGSYWRGIQDRMSDEYYQGQSMGYNFRQGLYDVDYGNAGWWAVQGFINGAYSQNVWSVGWNIAESFLNGLKTRGRQGSPWKTTFESGAWAGEGLKEGIESSERAVVGAAYGLADQVIDALDVGDIAMNPTLTGHVSNIPVMSYDDDNYSPIGNRRNVIIEQTNNNYTNYSLAQVNRDLAYELSKI